MKKGLFFIFIFYTIFSINAQETIATSGGNISDSGGNVSYSVGQVVYTAIAGTAGSAIHGVQQPYEISIISGLENTEDINLAFSVYPNPVSDLLLLKTKNNNQSLQYALYDVKGKLMVNGKVYGNETTISMKNFLPAIYFLKVSQIQDSSNSQVVKTFKISKL